jgi:hypothetical protein
MGEELYLKDDVLAPDRFFVFTYTGKNPIAVMKIARELISDAYGIPGKKLFDDEWVLNSYDRENREFRGTWRGENGLDNYTKITVIIKVIGTDKKSTNEGTFTVQVYPMLETTVRLGTGLHKAAWWIWHYFFYKYQRRRYIHRHVQLTKLCKKLLAERIGVAVKFS